MNIFNDAAIAHIKRQAAVKIGGLVKEFLTPTGVPTPGAQSKPQPAGAPSTEPTMHEALAYYGHRIQEGTRWSHYKGDTYRVDFLELDTDDCTCKVSYVSEKTGIRWTRKASEFISNVEINGQSVPRFAKLGK